MLHISRKNRYILDARAVILAVTGLDRDQLDRLLPSVNDSIDRGRKVGYTPEGIGTDLAFDALENIVVRLDDEELQRIRKEHSPDGHLNRDKAEILNNFRGFWQKLLLANYVASELEEQMKIPKGRAAYLSTNVRSHIWESTAENKNADLTIIKERIREALDLKLHRHLLKLEEKISSWPMWMEKYPDKFGEWIPHIIESCREEGTVSDRKLIVELQGHEFQFLRKVTSESAGGRTVNAIWCEYFDLDLIFDGSYVFGIEAKDITYMDKEYPHNGWSDTKFVKIDGYIRGDWTEVFSKLRSACRKQEKEAARLRIEEEKKIKLEEKALKRNKFGLD